jgi:hypothetical protein
VDVSQHRVPMVGVDTSTGAILMDGVELYQADAVKLAENLLQAVEDSIWRTQRQHNGAWFHRTEQIIARAESRLGKAIAATRKVYS